MSTLLNIYTNTKCVFSGHVHIVGEKEERDGEGRSDSFPNSNHSNPSWKRTYCRGTQGIIIELKTKGTYLSNIEIIISHVCARGCGLARLLIGSIQLEMTLGTTFSCGMAV